MKRKLFIQLVVAFVATTIIGTLSHEFGHYLVGTCLGYDMRMNYATTFLQNDANLSALDSFLITLGGPVQTILTGTVGCVLLFVNRRRFWIEDQLSLKQWITVFVSLFWLRQVTNGGFWAVSCLIAGKAPVSGDELKIATYLNLPDGSLLLLTSLIGTLVLAVILFKFIPSSQRITFILSGLTGGVIGYVFWLVLFGKYVMP